MKEFSLSVGEIHDVTGLHGSKIVKYLKSKKIKPVLKTYNTQYYLIQDLGNPSFLELLRSLDIHVTIEDFRDRLQERFDNEKRKKEEKEKQIEVEKERQAIINSFSKDFQKRIYQEWFTESFKDREYILHIGDTGSGKTYHAVKDLMESKGKRAYLSPLRLLAWEIYEKFNEQNIDCTLITGEERIENKSADMISSTIEMFNYGNFYESIVIDECFMISDKDRGRSWLKAILLANAKRVHLILNKESEGIIRNILDTTGRRYIIKEYTRLVPLELTKKATHLDKVKPKTLNVVFSKLSVLRYKNYFESKNKKVSVLYGDLPPEVKKQQMQLFIDGETDVCVSTDVIGMGLNLPCETVNFIETSKFDGEKTRSLNHTEIKQIAGRAGRFGYTTKGFVTANDGYFLKNNIASAMGSFTPVTKTFFGIYDDYLDIIPGETLSQKIKSFKESNFIPDSLNKCIFKEPVTKYTDLIIPIIDKLPVNIGWALITMPIRKSSKDYWLYMVQQIYNGHEVKYPSLVNNVEIKNTNQLQGIEGDIQKIELFLYAHNNKSLTNFLVETDIEKLKERRYTLVNMIMQYLLTKTEFEIKKCEDCGCEMDPFTKFKTCYDCYMESRW